MLRYEIATLTNSFGSTPKVAAAIENFSNDAEARGKLLGVFAADIGQLNQVIVLRGFETDAELTAERERTLAATSPFGSAEWLIGLTLESYAPFPFLPPVEPGEYGPIYEIRTYGLKTGGLQPTIPLWEGAVPARSKFSALTIALYGLDGTPRITQIWPYKSLAERSAARADSVAQGAWPPKGGPDWLTTDMRSTIGLPTAVSPLR